MIRMDFKNLTVDALVVAFFLLLAAGVSHRLAHVPGDSCGNASHSAQASTKP